MTEGDGSTDQVATPPRHPLLEPLDPAQQALVDLIFARVVVPGQDWPVYDYLYRTMRPASYDAAQVLLSFPVAENRNNPSLRYRHFFTAGNGGAAQRRDERIHLTIAGLSSAQPPGPLIAQFLVGVISVLARHEREIIPDPDAEVSQTFVLREIVRSVPGFQSFEQYLPLLASVLEREVPLWGSTWSTTDQDGTTTYNVDVKSDLGAFFGVAGSDDYFDRLLDVMGSNRPMAPAPPVDHPLALIDEIGYLDAVWQARLKAPGLFGAARVASCAGLALPCGSSEDFDARMNALYDVLNQISVQLDPAEEVALKGKPGSLQRFRLRLKRELPDEDFARVDSAIGLLQDAIRIRAALHSGLQGELPGRYASLGLTFPPTDYSGAWDHIRGRCSSAVRSIRQAMETLP